MPSGGEGWRELQQLRANTERMGALYEPQVANLRAWIRLAVPHAAEYGDAEVVFPERQDPADVPDDVLAEESQYLQGGGRDPKVADYYVDPKQDVALLRRGQLSWARPGLVRYHVVTKWWRRPPLGFRQRRAYEALGGSIQDLLGRHWGVEVVDQDGKVLYARAARA